MRRRPSFRLFALLGLAALPLLSACEIAPATGRTIFTGGLSAEQESQLGYQQHQKIVPQFGGAYSDPALTSYVGSIGNLLARTSETPDTKFTFTVLDTPMVNAFALPGGYVYVTRGLLSLAGNEAEVAGVLAHEIGHVTARHGTQAILRSLGLEVLFGLMLGELGEGLFGGIGASLLSLSYSREAEAEADRVALALLGETGIGTQGLSAFFTRLAKGGPELPAALQLLSTHPSHEARARLFANAGGAEGPAMSASDWAAFKEMCGA